MDTQPGKMPTDRRVDTARRARVAAMTREELVRELLTDQLTGLPNLRCWDEDRENHAGSLIALFDLDCLKWVNDAWGYRAGDALLCAFGEAMRKMGFKVYRVGGDEFLLTLDGPGDLVKLLTQAGRAVASEPFSWGGKTAIGMRFSFGVGQNLDRAEAMLKRVKLFREQTGQRARRGDKPVGLSLVVPPSGGILTAARA